MIVIDELVVFGMVGISSVVSDIIFRVFVLEDF